MAGFNTLLWAFREQDLMTGWLVDDKVYFECKLLLEALPDATNIHYVNVHDRRCFVEALQQVKPRVIILDVAPNWHELPILDLYQLFDALEQYPPSNPRFIVFDHSLVGPLFDPSGFIERHPPDKGCVHLRTEPPKARCRVLGPLLGWLFQDSHTRAQ